jgi:hypothetical protein
MKSYDPEEMMKFLAEQIVRNQGDPTSTLAILISETVKLRDQLKSKTGETLTVHDTRQALLGLEARLAGKELPENLTSTQKSLLKAWSDRLLTN